MIQHKFSTPQELINLLLDEYIWHNEWIINQDWKRRPESLDTNRARLQIAKDAKVWFSNIK